MSAASLIAIGERSGSDKAEHGYLPFYDELLSDRRDDLRRLLEIGVGGFEHPDDPAYGGESLRMWKEYFAKAHVVGVDILEKPGCAEDRITVVRGSQTDELLLARVCDEHGPFDLIIDDGSHIPALTIRSFQLLFPMLESGGWYVIEDTCTSYWPLWGGRFRRAAHRTTMGFVKARVDGLNFAEFKIPRYEPSAFDRDIVEIRARHNIVAFRKGDNSSPSTMNRPHPLPLGGWARTELAPAAVEVFRRPAVLRTLDFLNLRALAGAARRRLVPNIDR